MDTSNTPEPMDISSDDIHISEDVEMKDVETKSFWDLYVPDVEITAYADGSRTVNTTSDDSHIPEDVEMTDAETSREPSYSTAYMNGTRTVYLDMLLKYAYASYLRPIILELTKDHCDGCIKDYPSQRDHACLMTPFSDHVVTWLETALDNLDESKAVELWFIYLARVTPKVRYHEISPFLDMDWRWGSWIDEIWKQDVTEKLVVLNENPNFLDELVPAHK